MRVAVITMLGRFWLVLGAAGCVAGIAAQTQPSPQQTAATLDRMIAAHKSQQELAQYVFDTHGCKSCHTVGQNGTLPEWPKYSNSLQIRELR